MNNDAVRKAKKFITEHKTEMIIAGISATIIMGIAIGARYQLKQLSMLNYIKDRRIDNLEKVCTAKDARINELKQLCVRKDDVFKAVISDSLKHGSSEAGRHMAERKAYLHQFAS